MLASKIDADRIEFFFKSEGSLVPLDVCKETLPAEEYAALLLLQEMVENGTAKREGERFVTQHEEVAALPMLDQQLLNLPPPYPFQIRIDSKGRLYQDSLAFDLGFYEHPQGNRFEAGLRRP